MHNDKISIDRLPSGKYRYRVWDSNAKRYESASFARLPEDAKRDRPGTAAGDRWASAQLARYRLGQATAEPAAVESVVAAYLGQLGRDRPASRPLNPTHVADVTRTLNGLVAACPGMDLNRTPQARASIRVWLDNLKAKAVSEKTQQVIRRNLTLAPKTKARYLVHVNSMIAWAMAEGIVARNPVGNLSVPQEGKKLEPTFSLDQIRAFLALDQPESAPWLWVTVMLYTGMRRSEALSFTWADILWKQNLVKVVGKGRKARLIRLQPQLRDILMELGGPEAERPRVGPVICGPDFTGLNRRYEWALFRKTIKAAGIEADIGIDPVTKRMARMHPHTCRHTYGGMMLATGWDSMMLALDMGHEDEDITQHYAQSATMCRAQIEREGWEPGELRLRAVKRRKQKAG